MTQASGIPPFTGFPGFAPSDMFDKMMSMMRLTPFGSASASSSPMMAVNVDELEKRIADMRAVEQWLKLNLSMLQSAIQTLEVQRATVATLQAFGSFAQASMSGPKTKPEEIKKEPKPSDKAKPEAAEANGPAAFDPSGWWNLLQSQFNQIAQFAMTQGQAMEASATSTAPTTSDKPESAAANTQTASAKTAAAKRAKRPGKTPDEKSD